jgi:hypothetical protein
MMTECNRQSLEFEGCERRQVVAEFDAGRVTSDAGVLLLREVALRSGLLERFAACFTDYRNQDLIEHSVLELVGQRVLALACGYEDLNDHDTLRDDPVMALAAGKGDLFGQQRKQRRDRGHALAGKSTLNRLERTPSEATAKSRYHKIVYHGSAIDDLLIEVFLRAHSEPPREIVLDCDATDDPLHGKQEGRFFHGYYRSYCYLPLYIFCDDFLLCARLRPANIDGSDGTVQELERIVSRIRAQWPEVTVIIRGDSGFAREELMSWCEQQGVQFVLGLAKNARLKAAIADQLAEVEAVCEQTGKPARQYVELEYRTLQTWSRSRRVVAKAEHLVGKSNPRFVVTSLPPGTADGKTLYEECYCARGDMENRIKEQQLALFADRTSTATLHANQLRLYFSSIAYVLVNELRRVGLPGTALERAQCDTIRTRLLKIGGLLRRTVRRIRVALSSAFPLQELFQQVLRRIRHAYSGAA